MPSVNGRGPSELLSFLDAKCTIELSCENDGYNLSLVIIKHRVFRLFETFDWSKIGAPCWEAARVTVAMVVATGAIGAERTRSRKRNPFRSAAAGGTAARRRSGCCCFLEAGKGLSTEATWRQPPLLSLHETEIGAVVDAGTTFSHSARPCSPEIERQEIERQEIERQEIECQEIER
jgi:hypothetical protein